MMALKTFLFALAFFPFVVHAQTVHVKKESSRIEGRLTDGFQVAFGASEEEVRNSLTKYLKTIGKTKTSGDYITLAEPAISGRKYSATLYATARQSGNNTAAWFGIDSGSREESSLEGDLEKMAYDFGVTFHREQIQLQIDESLRALQTVEKQRIRLTNQNKDLTNKIERNKREKVQLEKSLVDNKLELDDLTIKLENNAKAQDSVALATEQIKKVVEIHQEKHRKVQ